MKVETQWGPRFRLQVRLPEGNSVNVRIHACSGCNFVEWTEASGEKVADVMIGDLFIAQLSSVVRQNKNRCLPELVPEGLVALGEYGQENRLLKTVG